MMKVEELKENVCNLITEAYDNTYPGYMRNEARIKLITFFKAISILGDIEWVNADTILLFLNDEYIEIYVDDTNLSMNLEDIMKEVLK